MYIKRLVLLSRSHS